MNTSDVPMAALRQYTFDVALFAQPVCTKITLR